MSLTFHERTCNVVYVSKQPHPTKGQLMDEPTNTVSGKALYRELVNGEQTAQVIVIPEGVTSKGSKNATTLLRRTVSKWSPRKTWQQDAAHTYKPELASALIADGTTAKFVEVADEGDAELMALEALTSTQSLLTYLIARDWTLRDTPLVLEVSVSDIDDLAAWKTPAALMRRLLRVRKAAGFPDDLFPVA